MFDGESKALQEQNDICSRLEAKLEMAEKALFLCECNLQLTIQIWIGAFENVERLLAKRADNSAEIARLIQQLREQAESEEEKELLEAASPRWSFSDNFGELLRQIVDGGAGVEGGEETANVMLPLLVDHASWKAYVEFLRAQAKHAERSEESSEKMIGRTRELVRQNQVLKSAVAERKRLHEQLAQLASIMECSNDAIVVYTLGGTIVSWNAAAKALYGYSPSEVLGRSRYMLAAPDQADEITEVSEKLKRQEKIPFCETTHIRKGGKPMRVCMSLSPVKEVNGDVVGCVAIVREIKDSKEALGSRSKKPDQKSV
jgi:PAS domain S-box-containing protein